MECIFANSISSILFSSMASLIAFTSSMIDAADLSIAIRYYLFLRSKYPQKHLQNSVGSVLC